MKLNKPQCATSFASRILAASVWMWKSSLVSLRDLVVIPTTHC